MSDYSYTSTHPKFQVLAYHLQRVPQFLEQLDIAVYMARRSFTQLNKSLEDIGE